MKLAKKMLACVMAIALIGCFAVVAFAEDAKATLTATATEAVKDQIVEVTLKLDGIKGLAALQGSFTYDKDVLEFADFTGSTISGLTIDGGKATDGKCTFGAMHSKSYQADNAFTLGVFKFKVLKADADAKLVFSIQELTVADAEGANGADLAFNAPADLTIKTVATSTATTTTAGTTATPPIPVTGDAGLAVAAGLVVLAGAAFVVSKKKK